MAQESDRALTPEGIRGEIGRIQELLRRHREGDVAALGPYTYVAAIKRLQYLRHRQRMFGRKILNNIKKEQGHV